MKKINKNISEIAFEIIHESETMENYDLGENTDKKGEELEYETFLSTKIVMKFLQMPHTKVQVKLGRKNSTTIVAHNTISNETIEIHGLGDHFIALATMVDHAKQVVSKLIKEEQTPILDHDFIQDLNKILLKSRRFEHGIGQYRHLTPAGKPSEVFLTIWDDYLGIEKPEKCVRLESGENYNIHKKMTELIDWVNNVAFKNEEEIMLDAAEFHARFVQIHPFRDGNGRLARLLTNYLLILNGKNLISIPSKYDDRKDYFTYLDYAIAYNSEAFAAETRSYAKAYDRLTKEYGPRDEGRNRYLPLSNFLKQHTINASSYEIIRDVLYYKTECPSFQYADQVSNDKFIDIDSDNVM